MARASFPSAILLCSFILGVAALEASNAQRQRSSVIAPDEHRAVSLPEPITVEAAFGRNHPREAALALLESVLPAGHRQVVPLTSAFLAREQQPVEPLPGHGSSKQEEMPPPSPAQQAADRFILAFFGFVCAYLYVQYGMVTPAFEDQRYSEESFAKFDSEDGGKNFCNPLACVEDRASINGCLCAFCCPCIRWAETISYVPGLLSFWQAFFGFLVCWYMLGISVTALVGWIAMTCLGVYYRREMRTRLAGKSANAGDFIISDVCSWCWCSCCMIAQEARHIERAMRYTRHTAVLRPEQQQLTNEQV